MTNPWPLQQLMTVPRVFAAPGLQAPGVKALFYEGEPYGGKPTRVFAWYGTPAHRRGEKLPAMVLVHGGGATALADWVRLWNARGYAALSMDTCGGIPTWNEGPYYMPGGWPRHTHSGPQGWGRFEETALPPCEQWSYHAVAAVIRGHSLLRSFPEVDPARIGITGVSWGGVLTCTAAGLDPRFRFAAPVYGCGSLAGDSVGLYDHLHLNKRQLRRWLQLWDPAVYLPGARLPMLWINGTNDFAFPMDAMQQSYRLPRGERTLCVKVRMPHAHGGAGENVPELFAYADQHCKCAAPGPRVKAQGCKNGDAWVTWTAASPVARAEFNFTRAAGFWPDRNWNTLAATIAPGRHTAATPLPHACTAWYFNLFDAAGNLVSSEHAE